MSATMTLRAIAQTSIWSAVLAPIGYLIITVMLEKQMPGLAPVPLWAGIGVAFGLVTAFTMEILPGLFYGRRPALGIVLFVTIGVAVYLGISYGLGTWLFASSMKEGLTACLYYSTFAGVILWFVSHAETDEPRYMFSGMIAGFMFQPALAGLGLAALPDLQQSLNGYICGFLLSAIHSQVAKSIYDRAYKR